MRGLVGPGRHQLPARAARWWGAVALLALGSAVLCLPARAATLRVPQDYIYIQEAVDAAMPGDVVEVAAGIWPEQVFINGKDITLEGAGRSATIIACPSLLYNGFLIGSIPNKPVVFIQNAGNVRVQHLTVDGRAFGNNNYRFMGVAYWNAGGQLTDVDVKRVRDTPLSPFAHGYGVYVNNSTNGPYSVEVADVHVTDYQSSGMNLFGTGLTANVHDCSTVGQGGTSVVIQNGIVFAGGAAGTLTDCSISDVQFTGSSSFTAIGLRVNRGSTMALTGSNTLTNCQSSLYWTETNGSMSGVQVGGTASYGLVIVNNQPVLAQAGAVPGTPAPGSPGAPPAPEPMLEDTARALPASAFRAQSLYTVTVSGGCLSGAGTVGSIGLQVHSAGGGLDVQATGLEVSDWDYGIAAQGAATVSANHCAIVSNVSAGYVNSTGGRAQDATYNWWGSASGPSGAGTGAGDAVLPGSGANVDFNPWLVAGTDTSPGCGFTPPPENRVTLAAPAGCITAADSCVAFPVSIARTTSDSLRGFSVTVALSPELRLCGAGIGEGGYLAGAGTTFFHAIDNHDGTYTVDGALLGLPCAAVGAGGTLFTLHLTGAVTTGTGTVALSGAVLRDCENRPVAGTLGGADTIGIDLVPLTTIAALAAAQVKSGNDADGTTGIAVSWPAVEPGATVEVYRAGYGQYPEYDDAGGTLPAVPVWPPGPPWTLAASLSGPTTFVDDPPLRDFWYYVAFVKHTGACGLVSAASNRTGGTLNYHLGDVADPANGASQGDNLVNTADISRLGAHYGIALAPGDPYAYLDVGPTSDGTTDGRPLTDDLVDFDDLMVFAMNYRLVSTPQTAAAPGDLDELRLEAPTAVRAGETFEVTLRMKGAGDLRGVSTRLSWDGAVAEPVATRAGTLLEGRGLVVYSPGSRSVDAALLGARAQGLAGEGTLAVVKFRALADGDPKVAIAATDARDARNRRGGLDTARPVPMRAAPGPQTPSR